MAPSQPVSILLLGALAVSTVFVGATAGDFFSDDPDPDELVAAVVNGTTEFETLQGVRTRQTTIEKVAPNRSKTWLVKERIWLDPPNKSRVDVLDANASASPAEGDVRIINGTTLLRYKADHGVMSVDRNWAAGDLGLGNDIELAHYDVDYLGTETVAGRETHVVRIQPAANASVKAALTLHLGSSDFGVMTVRAKADENATFRYTTTWWIDAETTYPIKERVEWAPADPTDHPDNVASKTMTVEYETLTFNRSIPGERFSFTPPNGTEVYHAAESLDVDSVEEADQAAPFAVPTPPLPDRFDLVQVSGQELKGNVSVNLLYSDGEELSESDTVQIRFEQGAPQFDEERIIARDAGRINATVVEYASGPILVYDCGGVRIQLSADIDGRDDLGFAFDVAESMGCADQSD